MKLHWKNAFLAAFAAVLLIASGLVACGGKDKDTTETTPVVTETPAPAADELRVTGVQLGTEIGADNRVTSPATTFGPQDTIYAVVTTDGNAQGARLAARWKYEDGQLVDQGEQTLNGSGTQVTEFHVSKPDGWPAGSYTVEITLDGRQAESRTFTIG